MSPLSDRENKFTLAQLMSFGYPGHVDGNEPRRLELVRTMTFVRAINFRFDAVSAVAVVRVPAPYYPPYIGRRGAGALS